jgi:ribosomal protein S18 acetylase RimI-like enzyme
VLFIRPLTLSNLSDAGQCDGAFWVDSRLVLSAEDGRVQYTVVSTPPYEKRYPVEPIDYAAYVGQPDKAVFLAYVNGQVAGQIRLCRWWNGFGYVDDIVVDRTVRRHGVGAALMEQAKQWGLDKGLPGLRLETQDNNVAACRLYARCGFELAGFDRRLYHSLHPGTGEVALFWYWIPKAP